MMIKSVRIGGRDIEMGPVGLSVESVLDDHVIMHDVVTLMSLCVVILSNTRSS